MKAPWIICLLLATRLAWADGPAAPTVLDGQVLETRQAGGYTYLRLKTRNGETWAAVDQATVKKGAKVSLENVMPMQNFESKALQKTFPVIYFGNLAGAGPKMAPHAGSAKTTDYGDIQVPKATGPNARTVAEIVGKAVELKDQTIQVRGKVVKYNPGIMGRNWVHLRDGSGAAADGSNDLLLTTTQSTTAGAIVTMSGIVRTDKDFGSGYAYKVLVEDAALLP